MSPRPNHQSRSDLSTLAARSIRTRIAAQGHLRKRKILLVTTMLRVRQAEGGTSTLPLLILQAHAESTFPTAPATVRKHLDPWTKAVLVARATLVRAQ